MKKCYISIENIKGRNFKVLYSTGNKIIYVSIISIILYILYIEIGNANYSWFFPNKSIRLELFYRTFLLFIVTYLYIILRYSKEFLIVSDENFIFKKYCLFFCYKKVSIPINDIKAIYWEDCFPSFSELYRPSDLLKNIKIRVKNTEFEDKIYAFGYKVKEEECQEILEKLKNVIKVKKSNI
ncbi:hypothetical protein [Fusobacterium nucleatum]|uniref:hypothetical protein n=1 Tax=Fusobacterium nucleatum TaxID=851 RepID=UPI0001B53544|nr:hypothetical protein [Fusobacterium nucleatum]